MHSDTPHPVILGFTQPPGQTPGLKAWGPLKPVPSQLEKEGIHSDSWRRTQRDGGQGSAFLSPHLSLPRSFLSCFLLISQNFVPLESLESGVQKKVAGCEL